MLLVLCGIFMGSYTFVLRIFSFWIGPFIIVYYSFLSLYCFCLSVYLSSYSHCSILMLNISISSLASLFNAIVEHSLYDVYSDFCSLFLSPSKNRKTVSVLFLSLIFWNSSNVMWDFFVITVVRTKQNLVIWRLMPLNYRKCSMFLYI